MTLEEARVIVQAHIDKFGSIQGFSHNSENKEVIEFLKNAFPDAKKNGELLYRALYGRPTCPDCGKYTSFMNFNVGFQKYCSICGLQQMKKRKKEPFEVHVICKQCGNEFTYMSTLDREKEQPRKQFCSKHCAQLHMHATMTEEKKAERLEKIKKTNLEKYGDEWVVNSRYTREKTKEKLGVEYAWQDKKILEKTYKWLTTEKDEEKINKVIEKQKATKREKYGDLMVPTAKYKDYVFPSGRTVKFQGFEDLAINWLLKTHDEDDIVIGRKEIHDCIGQIFYIGLDGREHEYFPDIYVKSENKLIDAKCQFTYDAHKDVNELKRRACLEKGFKFEFMIMNRRKLDECVII